MRKCSSAGVTPIGKQNLSLISSITPHPNTKADLKTPVLEKFLAEEETKRQEEKLNFKLKDLEK